MNYRVYFAQSENGLVKIGYCKDLQYRVYGLRHATRGSIEVLATIEGFTDSRDARAAEKCLHTRFAAHRVKGEWFNPAPELTNFIADAAMQAPSKPKKSKRVTQ